MTSHAYTACPEQGGCWAGSNFEGPACATTAQTGCPALWCKQNLHAGKSAETQNRTETFRSSV